MPGSLSSSSSGTNITPFRLVGHYEDDFQLRRTGNFLFLKIALLIFFTILVISNIIYMKINIILSILCLFIISLTCLK